MHSLSESLGHLGSLGTTERKDKWWAQPLLVFIGLTTFGIYSTWAALQGNHYASGPYLSPFYSPLIIVGWWKWSPAFLILWAPLGFRATCYYYRKAYYRSFFLNPPACAVKGVRKAGKYKGETTLPFVLQNIHRYMLIPATALLIFLWHDVYNAFWFDGKFGMGVGTLVLLVNTFFLTLYSFSCHSLRHLVGGKLNVFSCKKNNGESAAYKAWCAVSCLNIRHMLWAWISLGTVGFADLYVRLCSMGIWTDIRIF